MRIVRHTGLRTVLVIAALSATCVSQAEETSKATRPNIIFVFTDDHASHAIGAYGSKINQTPNIDRLAKEGMLFRNCFVTNSICAPSRAVILTGKHSHTNGVIDNRRRFDNTQQTFPKLMQEAGYETAMIGKWHLKAEPSGFDYWKVLIGQGTYYNPRFRTPDGVIKLTGYTTDIVTDLALEWLESGRDKSKPFVMMYQHKAPHREWQPGPDHLTMYDDVEIREPPTLFDNYAHRTSAASRATMTIARHMNDRDLKLVPPPYFNEEQLKVFNDTYGPKNKALKEAGPTGKDLVRWKYQRYIKDYLRCIASVDDNLGRVLDYLDKTGLAKDTVVIYSSDQGFYLGDHGWFDKRWMYEESLRMPLLVRWPGVTKPGSVNSDLVQNLDFAETFLEIGNAAVPDDMQGRSLVPVLKGKTPPDWRKSIYYQYYEFPGSHDVLRHYGVRTDRYKLIHYYDIGEWELFDLQEDPDELKSVHSNPKFAGIRKKLAAELNRLRKECGADRFEEPTVPGNPADVEVELVAAYGPGGIDGSNVVDSSGRAHHAKQQDVQLAMGRRGGKALKFGKEGLIRVRPVSAAMNPIYRPMTVGAWCKPERADGVIAAHGNQTFGYSLYLKGGLPHFLTTATGLAFEVTGPEKLPLGKWVHLAATVDGDARITLFVNGRPVGRLHRGFFVSQTPRDAFAVGADEHGTVGDYKGPMYYHGLMEDFRLYWGALDAAGFEQWVGPEAVDRRFSVLPDGTGALVSGPGGKHLFRYVATRPLGTKLTAPSVCCLHPIYTPAGTRATDFAPPDHPHHRGVFLAWYTYRGPIEADFWGWGEFSPVEGRIIENRSIESISADADGAELRTKSVWLTEGNVLLNEDLLLSVSQRGPANVIDMTYTLVPTSDAVLPQAAFGGLCARTRVDGKLTFHGPDGVQKLKPPHYLKPETDWPQAAWYDLVNDLDDGPEFGVAVIDHKDNPPTTWHNLASLAMVNPCIISSGDVQLKKGQPLVLRYRLVVHDGPVSSDLIEKLSSEFGGR